MTNHNPRHSHSPVPTHFYQHHGRYTRTLYDAAGALVRTVPGEGYFIDRQHFADMLVSWDRAGSRPALATGMTMRYTEIDPAPPLPAKEAATRALELTERYLAKDMRRTTSLTEITRLGDWLNVVRDALKALRHDH